MYRFLAMYVYQPPGSVFELPETISSAKGAVNSRNESLQVRTDSHPYTP